MRMYESPTRAHGVDSMRTNDPRNPSRCLLIHFGIMAGFTRLGGLLQFGNPQTERCTLLLQLNNLRQVLLIESLEEFGLVDVLFHKSFGSLELVSPRPGLAGGVLGMSARR